MSKQKPEARYGFVALRPAKDWAAVMHVSIPVKEKGKVVDYAPGYEITVSGGADDHALFTLTEDGINRLIRSLNALTSSVKS